MPESIYATVDPTDYDAVRDITEANAEVWALRFGTVVPVMTRECFVCKREVGTMNPAHVGLTRIKGDSRWGYEPFHLADCLS